VSVFAEWEEYEEIQPPCWQHTSVKKKKVTSETPRNLPSGQLENSYPTEAEKYAGAWSLLLPAE
jgi:hypothetical protein